MTASIAIPTAALVLPSTEDFVAAVTDAVAQRLQERQPKPSGSPWMTVAEIAAYIGCRPDRIYALKSAGRIPFEKEGSRLLFHRDAIDGWIRAGGGIRP